MHILGDIGNTDTKLCLVSTKYKIIKKIIFPSKNLNQKKLSKYFISLKPNYQKINKILFCSVVPKSFNLIKKFLSKKTKINCFEVKNLNLKSLIKIKVNYKQVGSDRITNAISLINNKNNFIILDFGTATTFDVVDHDGAYIGGVIAPGVNLSLEALHQEAAALPHVDIARPDRVIGKNTVMCMQSGVFWGYIGLLKEICERIKTEHGSKMKIISTGGLGPLFQSAEKVFDEWKDDLTMHGLRLIFEHNKSSEVK